MKAVLISIQAKWCEKIANGQRTIEVRKDAPKLQAPFKCYIYCAKKRMTGSLCMYSYLHINEPRVWSKYEKITTWGRIGDVVVNAGTLYQYISYGMHEKVIGEFVCDKIDDILCDDRDGKNPPLEELLVESCLNYEELCKYGNCKDLYGWHITDLKIYDQPKELSEFRNMKGEPIKRPFQSWGYINDCV